MTGFLRIAIEERKPSNKKCTGLCKGIAIIWMMYHYLVPYTEFTSGPVLFGIYLPGVIALTGKVCVSLFLFLSGYGLTKSAEGKKNDQMLAFTWGI